MRLVLYELKKIFEGKRVLAVVVLSALQYLMFMSFLINPFQHESLVLIWQEMIEDYGIEMNEADTIHFQQILYERISAFEIELAQRPEFVERDVLTLEDFNYQMNYSQSFWDAFHNDPIIGLFREINDRYWLGFSIIGFFDEETNEIRAWLETWVYEAEAQRWEEVIARGTLSFFPYEVFNTYRVVITSIAFLTVSSLIILISPLYISERRDHMLTLQYSSKTGRSLFWKRIIAVSLAVVIVTTIHLLFTLAIYLQSPASWFLDFDMSSGLNTPMWYDITFRRFIFLTSALVYLNGLLFALISLFISRLMPNYLTILGIKLPIVFAVISISYFDFVVVDVIRARFDENFRFNPPHLMPLFYLFIVIIIAILLFVQWKKEKKLDILL